jgi:hypothetical protein
MMPFYGRFDHFRSAVDSVLAQTNADWRLAILDDVYPDPAPGEWAGQIDDPRVRYLRNNVNLRPSRNYNKAVGIATNEFVQIMGCDDIMLPNYVQRVHELVAEFPDADIVQPGVGTIDENGESSRPLADWVKALYRPGGSGPRQYRGEQLAVSLLRGNWTYFPSLVWRRERLLGGFRTDLDVVQDLAMLFDIVATGGNLVLDDRVVFSYRRHGTSVSAVTGYDGSKFIQENTLFTEAASSSRALGWPKAARVARAHVSSRLNAASELPGAVRSRNRQGMSTLVRHVLGMPDKTAPDAK